jgi:hypothetical protein
MQLGSTPIVRPTQRFSRALIILLWAAAGAALLLNRAAPAANSIGEAEKTGGRHSFAGQVEVARQPQFSPLNPSFDAERLWSGEDDWEPANAVDPSSDYVYQLTTRYSGPAACPRCALPAIVFRRSTDGGATWEPDRFLSPSRRSQNDPMIEVAADGAIYVAWLEQYRPGVKFARSTDHGETWSAPVIFTDLFSRLRWNDRPVLALSKDGRHVYIAFNSSDSYVVASHDYGATWARPVKTNDDGRYWFHSAGAVAPDGTVYFGAVDFSQDYSGPANVGVLRSADGGATWTHALLDVSAEMPDCSWAAGCYFGFFGSSIGLAVDDAGAVLAAYHAGDAPGEPQRMFVRYAADGLILGPRAALSADSLEHNAFPAVAAGPGAGDFRVVWQGSFDGRTDAWNTWFRRTADGGLTWSDPLRLSDTTTPAPYHRPDGYRFPYGDYLELAVDANGRNYVVWGEGVSYNGPGGTWYTRGE